MKTIVIKIKGMTCVMCSSSVERALLKVKGVKSANVSFATENAIITCEESVAVSEMKKAINKVGFKVVSTQNRDEKNANFPLLVSVVLSFPLLAAMFTMHFNIHALGFLHNPYYQMVTAGIVQFIIGFRFIKGAVHAIAAKTPNMDVLVSLGTLSAYFYSVYIVLSGGESLYFEASAVIITLILLGKTLEKRAKNQITSTISKLYELSPKTAAVIKNGEQTQIPIEQIEVGDIVVIKPGESVPIDGKVVSGETDIDQSMLTGEPLPVAKKTGDKVFAGTVNKNGSVNIKAEKTAKHTVLSDVIRLTEQAFVSKAPLQKLADRVTVFFVPAVLIISAITLVTTILVTNNIGMAVSNAVSVLVVACPCSLGLATPAAVIAGTGLAARKGILIKSGEALEGFVKAKAFILDKTGTITAGEPKIKSHNLDEKGKEIAAIAEKKSEHPIGKAVYSAFDYGVTPEPDVFEASPGGGVLAEYKGKKIVVGNAKFIKDNGIINPYSKPDVVFVAANKKILGYIEITDTIKPQSAEAVKALIDLGKTVYMATGDSEKAAKEIGGSVGITNVVWNVLPDQKAQLVEKIKSEGKITVFAGDGINDAIALAGADFGVAMGNGTSIAAESADIILLRGDLSLLAETIKISKLTARKIRQNLFWAFIYNVIGIPFAAFGLLNPIIAGTAMALSSVSVLTNSLLISRKK